MISESERKRRLRDKLMTKLFDDKIIDSIINIKHIQTMHNKDNNTNITLLNRSIDEYEKTKSASTFDCNIKEYIQNTLMDSVPEIIEWLTSSHKNTITITHDQAENAGHGIENKAGKIKEYTTKDVTIVLIKDDNNEIGFQCHTAYPNITSEATTRTPTNRNLIPDLIQTRTFKKSTPEKRTSLINAATKGLNRPLTFMEQMYADIVSSPYFTDNMQIESTKNQIDIRHMTDVYAILHIMPDKTKFEYKTTPELLKISKLANDKINKHLKRPVTTKLTRSERFRMAGIEDQTNNTPDAKQDSQPNI